MGRYFKPSVFVDKNVSSVPNARSYAKEAEDDKNRLKEELWGLVMATPKDIVSNGEDPITTLRGYFDDIWEQLWDAFVDDYKYTAIADDAEYTGGDESLVQKVFDEEAEEERKNKEEIEKRKSFFKKYPVFDSMNFDDSIVYDEWREGRLKLGDSLTKEEADEVKRKLKEEEEKRIKEAWKRVVKD